MVRENPDSGPTCLAAGRWCRDPSLPLSRSEITRFPHAVLEVKVRARRPTSTCFASPRTKPAKPAQRELMSLETAGTAVTVLCDCAQQWLFTPAYNVERTKPAKPCPSELM